MQLHTILEKKKDEHYFFIDAELNGILMLSLTFKGIFDESLFGGVCCAGACRPS